MPSIAGILFKFSLLFWGHTLATLSLAVESSRLSLPREQAAICVDLDGTLIRTDLLAESLIAAVRTHPWVLFLLPFWFFKGRAVLKSKLARFLSLKPANLPYHEKLIEFLCEKRENGHSLYLTTAANVSLADLIAKHLNIFDGVLASDGDENNKGERKLRRIQALLQGKPFLYVGDSRDDLAIWKESSGAITVGASNSVRRALARTSVPVENTFERPRTRLRTWLKAIRMHQWSKNILVFIPLFLSHQFHGYQVLNSVLGFLAFSACASTFYVINDLLDVEADRSHPRKCKRPFAAGDLKIQQGLGLVVAGFAAVIALSLMLPLPAKGLLLLYAAINLLYSGTLKQTLFLDVLVLAFLYTLRILFGAASENIAVSVWTLAFSIFLFLGLALIKRLTELMSAKGQNVERLARRAYMAADVSAIRSFASSALYLSVLVLALYINSPDVVQLYSRPQALWFVCLLLIYWVSRVTLIANRGLMSDDPVIFALKDRTSQIVAALVIFCVVLAL